MKNWSFYCNTWQPELKSIWGSVYIITFLTTCSFGLFICILFILIFDWMYTWKMSLLCMLLLYSVTTLWCRDHLSFPAHQRNFLLQQMENITEVYILSKCRKVFEAPRSTLYFYNIICPPSGNLQSLCFYLYLKQLKPHFISTTNLFFRKTVKQELHFKWS